TAADVVAHGGVDVGVAGVGVVAQQRYGGHDLTGLAVTALRHVDALPGLLDGVAAISRETFYRGDGFACYEPDFREAAAGGNTINMHGACAAQRHAAAILGTSEV